MAHPRAAVLAALFLILGVSSSAAAEGEALDRTLAPADSEEVAIMGRVAMIEGSAHMGFPGITVRFVYRGPAPTLLFIAGSEDCYFNVSLDGADPVVMRLEEGLNEVALPFADGPDEGSVVEIVRRTESWMGEVAFQGLLLPDGSELLTPPAWPQRRLMVIGDSTATGKFNERFPPLEEASARTTNAARSYGMIMAERLNAQVHLVAYGGQGLIRDWSGATEGEEVVLVPDYFERSLPRAPGAYWDHREYVPEVIVINLGTDLEAGPLGVEEYTDVYDAFVKQVRGTYPLSYIVVTESSFLSDKPGSEGVEARSTLRATLENVVARSREAGDQRILMAEASYYPGTPNDAHLTVFQHEKLAEELLAPIREITAWK